LFRASTVNSGFVHAFFGWRFCSTSTLFFLSFVSQEAQEGRKKFSSRPSMLPV